MSSSPPRLSRLILHIGMFKTGTTSVQQFLCENDARLSQAGVLYPKSCRHMYGKPIWCHHAVAAAMAAQGAGTDLERFWQSVDMLELRRELSDSGARELVLSAEDLCPLENPALLQKAFAADHTTILMYVRNQTDFVNAMYYTMVGHVRSTLTPREYVEQKLLRVLDYHAIAARWREAFPGADMRVRSYDRGTPARDDAVADMLRQSGLDRVLEAPRTRLSSHPTLPAAASRVLHDLLLSGIDSEAFLRIHALAHQVYGSQNLLRSRLCISLEQIVELAGGDFEASNRRLRREFMDGVDSSPFGAPGSAVGDDAGVDYFAEDGGAKAIRRLLLDTASLGSGARSRD